MISQDSMNTMYWIVELFLIRFFLLLLLQVPHFDVVGQALIYTLETALGEKFTKEAREGWTQVYSVVSTGMIEGCYYAMLDEAEVVDEEMEEELLRKEEEALFHLLGDAAFLMKDVRATSTHSRSLPFCTSHSRE